MLVDEHSSLLARLDSSQYVLPFCPISAIGPKFDIALVWIGSDYQVVSHFFLCCLGYSWHLLLSKVPPYLSIPIQISVSRQNWQNKLPLMPIFVSSWKRIQNKTMGTEASLVLSSLLFLRIQRIVYRLTFPPVSSTSIIRAYYFLGFKVGHSPIS